MQIIENPTEEQLRQKIWTKKIIFYDRDYLIVGDEIKESDNKLFDFYRNALFYRNNIKDYKININTIYNNIINFTLEGKVFEVDIKYGELFFCDRDNRHFIYSSTGSNFFDNYSVLLKKRQEYETTNTKK